MTTEATKRLPVVTIVFIVLALIPAVLGILSLLDAAGIWAGSQFASGE